MGSNNYVPRPDVQFCMWTRTVLNYSTDHHERWGVMAPPATLMEALIDLEEKVDRCTQPTRSKVDTLVKNEARRKVETGVRNYLQGVVVRNVNVTEEDREMMSLPLRDTVPTPVGEPQGQAEADISYPERTKLQLRIKHVEGTPVNARANYGCRVYFGVYAPGQDPPAVEEDLRDSRFTRQKKMVFSFRAIDSGKTAWFCIRYENSKGETGQWGPMMHAVIP